MKEGAKKECWERADVKNYGKLLNDLPELLSDSNRKEFLRVLSISNVTSNLCHHVEKPVGFHLDANINQLAEIKCHVTRHLVLVDVSCEVHSGDLHLGAGPSAHLVTRVPVTVVQLRRLLARVLSADCCISVGLSLRNNLLEFLKYLLSSTFIKMGKVSKTLEKKEHHPFGNGLKLKDRGHHFTSQSAGARELCS